MQQITWICLNLDFCVHFTATHYCFSVHMQVVCIILIFLSPSQIFFLLYYVWLMTWEGRSHYTALLMLLCKSKASLRMNLQLYVQCCMQAVSQQYQCLMPFSVWKGLVTFFHPTFCFFFHIICFPFLHLNPGRCVPVPSSSYLSSISVHYFLLFCHCFLSFSSLLQCYSLKYSFFFLIHAFFLHSSFFTSPQKHSVFFFSSIINKVKLGEKNRNVLEAAVMP